MDAAPLIAEPPRPSAHQLVSCSPTRDIGSLNLNLNQVPPARSVLVVDDDECVRETLAELLDLAGFITIQAAHTEEALAVLRQRADIAAVVTDLTMPGEDGIALIRRARAIRHGLPAILLTGYAEEVASVATTAGENFHVLRKPVESGRLIDQLDLLLAPTPAR